jgi:hypothetical protein
MSKSVAKALSRLAASEGLLFYPGSGTDFGPLKLFGEHWSQAAVVYADSGRGIEQISAMLHAIPGLSVQPGSILTAPDVPESGSLELRPALRASLRSAAGSTIEFFYLKDDALEALKALIRTGRPPTAVVLQDHGFGGATYRFGGDSSLYEAARRVATPPQTLFVAENSDPWPGYEQASDFELFEGQEHGHKRAVFVRA